MEGFKFIAIGFMVFGMAAAARAIADIFSALLESTARNPSAADQLQKMALIGAGLSEAMGLFSFIIVMLLLFT
ncbi:F0F1 ATP synthase subunit C [Rickettsia endosymbiont of Cardiosporidium cionae]|uniref:F0F1 ATP synthase subunit C n=1 Tax=Rickettsia endosymbiont of Cardiosporidium cionae TaxID=2777155 RepID=UPI00189505CA|nr:F0F1 ATP synthase subunit C [Rickettsia endosymbiont of Cardiosporidium cionae]KAF8818585.1 F0F1 ATP synthase subunit C [Rickettsia endosymbiont of Cardiosporidium cionae]